MSYEHECAEIIEQIAGLPETLHLIQGAPAFKHATPGKRVAVGTTDWWCAHTPRELAWDQSEPQVSLIAHADRSTACQMVSQLWLEEVPSVVVEVSGDMACDIARACKPPAPGLPLLKSILIQRPDGRQELYWVD